MKQNHSWPVIPSVPPWPHMWHTKLHSQAAISLLQTPRSCLLSPSFVNFLDVNLGSDCCSWSPPSPGWFLVALVDEKNCFLFSPTSCLVISLGFLKTDQGESVTLSKLTNAMSEHIFFPQRAHSVVSPRASLDITLLFTLCKRKQSMAKFLGL